MLEQVREAFDLHREHSQNSNTSTALLKLMEVKQLPLQKGEVGARLQQSETMGSERYILNNSNYSTGNISGSSSNLVRRMVVTGKGGERIEFVEQRSDSAESILVLPQPQNDKEPSKAVRSLMGTRFSLFAFNSPSSFHFYFDFIFHIPSHLFFLVWTHT
jgi:hypothetical protein